MRTGENIYKRKDGRWEGRVPVGRRKDGKLKYKSLYGHTYKEVKFKKVVWQQQHFYNEQFHEWKPSKEFQKVPTFHETAIAWLADSKKNWKPSTYNKYYNCLYKYLLPEWKNKCLTEITQENYENLLTDLKESPYTTVCNTVNLILRGIKNYLKSDTIFSISIIPTITSLQRKPETLTEAEQKKLSLYAAKNISGDNLGILLSLYEGIRIGELCALRWSDIDLKEQVIHISQTVQRIRIIDRKPNQPHTMLCFGLPKSGEKRIIPIHPKLIETLKKEKKKYQSSAFVLTGSTHVMEPRTFSNRFHKTLKLCGIRKVNVHMLRHPYVKHTTKIFSLHLNFLQVQFLFFLTFTQRGL